MNFLTKKYFFSVNLLSKIKYFFGKNEKQNQYFRKIYYTVDYSILYKDAVFEKQ